jgi:LytS/YehU family sensor histidine kinase
LLREEMQFLTDYFSLLVIRFEKAVQLNTSIPDYQLDQFLIPSISLQVLVENAIKHNEFSDASPLVVNIGLEHEVLIIHNQVHKKTLRKPSSRIGLNNLDERYKLTTGKEIVVNATDNEFTVYLPVLKIG